MVEFEIPNKVISNVLKVGGVLIVLVMVATLIKPSITGNVVNRMNELNENLTTCMTELADANDLSQSQDEAITVMTSDVANLTALYESCSTDLENKTGEVAYLKGELKDIDRSFENLQIDLNVTKDNYRYLAEFAAKAKCCIQNTLDDMQYDSYDIEANTISCQENNNGEYTLEC